VQRDNEDFLAGGCVIFAAPYSFIASTNLGLHIHPEHLADLRASGLSDNTIRAAGVYSLAPTNFQQFFSGKRGVPSQIETALCFPYQGGHFARIKLFPSLGKMKYAQPPKTGAHLYRPFVIGNGPVYVCEGEKKTLAARQAGLNAVGIGGVWNWLQRGTADPINDFKLVDWERLDVVLVPDSDVWARRNLMNAIYALGREIQSLGAYVEVAQIPQNGEKKVGLDDYLFNGGAVNALETYRLSASRFKSFSAWHSKWLVNKVLNAAA
jgi:putative DNA primase/helicase